MRPPTITFWRPLSTLHTDPLSNHPSFSGIATGIWTSSSATTAAPPHLSLSLSCLPSSDPLDPLKCCDGGKKPKHGHEVQRAVLVRAFSALSRVLYECVARACLLWTFGLGSCKTGLVLIFLRVAFRDVPVFGIVTAFHM